MAEYERSRLIQLPAEEVFAFATDPTNLPNYLPTVRSAEPAGEGRIRTSGERRGVAYEDEGWCRLDEATRRMEWGADGGGYAGWLAVSPEEPDGASRVIVHLSFAPFQDDTGRPITEADGGDAAVAESLEAALESLRNLMEGRGGKEEPASVA